MVIFYLIFGARKISLCLMLEKVVGQALLQHPRLDVEVVRRVGDEGLVDNLHHFCEPGKRGNYKLVNLICKLKLFMSTMRWYMGTSKIITF